MHPIFVQAGYYSIVMLITIIFVSAMLRGFFWKYVKVRTSFGKYVLIKMTSKLRDYFIIGWVEENQLKFNYKKIGDKKKILSSLPMPTGIKPEYRALGVNWIDVDEEKMAIIVPATPDQRALVSTNDVETTDQLLRRRIEEPNTNTSMEKVILVLVIITGAIALVVAYMVWKGNANDQIILSAINTLKQSSPVIINGGL